MNAVRVTEQNSGISSKINLYSNYMENTLQTLKLQRQYMAHFVLRELVGSSQKSAFFAFLSLYGQML